MGFLGNFMPGFSCSPLVWKINTCLYCGGEDFFLSEWENLLTFYRETEVLNGKC